jgi:hypothetical protein
MPKDTSSLGIRVPVQCACHHRFSSPFLKNTQILHAPAAQSLLIAKGPAQLLRTIPGEVAG